MKKRRKPSKAGRWFLEPIGKKDEEGNKSPATMRKFCIFDIESKDGDSQKAGFTRPFMVGFYDPDEPEFAERYSEFRNEPHLAKRHWRRRHLQPGGCIDKLMTKFLQPKYAGRILYAHFGGNFDHLFLPAWLVMHQDEYGFEIIPVQSSIQVLRVWRKPENPEDEIKEEWDFLDTHKLLPMALAKACKAFRVPNKLDMDLHRHEDSPEWGPYLRRDCEALAQVMRSMYSMVHDRLGGEMGITTPSTSMKLFRRRFMGAHNVSEKIPRFAHWRGCAGAKLDFDAPGSCPGCAHDWIRRGYYGGRTEIFRMYGTNLSYFDISSSYVAAMKQEMPIGARDDSHRFIDRPGDAIQWERHRSDANPDANWTGFAEVTVFIPESCPIPPLPHKNRESKKLQFPVGQFHGVWSLEELALLNDPLVQGRIVHTFSVVYFKLAPCFGPMVRELWTLRDTGNPDYDPGLSELAKLLGNGLYGKFAMRQQRATMVFKKPSEPDCCDLCSQPTVGGTALCLGCEGSKPASETDPDCPVWYQAKKVDAPYIIPHISAHITARARVRLWQFMKTALRTKTGERQAKDFREGDVAFLEDRAHLVLQAEVLDTRVEMVLRDLDAEIDATRLGDVAWTGGHHAHLGQGGTVYYSDSVTGDRTTVVQDPGGTVHVLPFEELWRKASRVMSGDDKSRATLKGWKALSSTGWSPIEQIIRHQAGKVTHRVTTKEGQTEVTTDHGIMVEGEAVSPKQFVRRKLSFTKAVVPVVTLRKTIDLYDYVRDFEHRLETPRGEFHYRIEAYGNRLVLKTNALHDKGLWFRRFYKQGTAEWSALLRLVSAYVSDGSVSIRGQTTNTRFLFSLCDSKLEWMEQQASDLSLLTNAKISGPFWTGATYMLDNGTAFMAVLWAALAGIGSAGKRLPSFFFHLNGADYQQVIDCLLKGDAFLDKSSEFRMDSTSQRLTAGISLLMSQHGQKYSFAYRPSKKSWLIRTRSQRARAGRVIRHEVTAANRSTWVYDLSVKDSHTFVDGIGQVLLHNTDSIITDAKLPPTSCQCTHERKLHAGPNQEDKCAVPGCGCIRLRVHIWGTGSKLGEMKDEHPGESLNYLAVQPKVYLIERSNHNAAWAEGQALRKALSEGHIIGDEAIKLQTRIAEAEQEVAFYKFQADAAYGTYAKSEMYSVDKLDPIAGKYHAKVTMKGFPPNLRTRENLEKLRGGKIDWDEIKKGNAAVTGPGETLEWAQLEKVRTIARRGFVDPPRMRERCRDCVWDGKTRVVQCVQCAAGKGPIAVSKSFQTLYDKRELLKDGSGRTKGVAIYEPVGGIQNEDSDFSKAAE